ncbi:MAG: hypothetical protein D3925_09585, partial [Candidatus Electrothrix sp. AR5]|nr:hypothetical protein [Candidatus Electrothrix sp. AR5]
VIAVSGGPDSMALLHLLADTRKRLELDLTGLGKFPKKKTGQ